MECISLTLNFGGEYEEIKSFCGNYFSNMEGEDTTIASFKFTGGHLGLLIYSWSTKNPPRVPAFEIYGENGSLIEDPNSRVPGKPYGDIIFNGERIEVEKVDPIEVELREFLKAVENNTEVPMKPEIALRDLEAVLKIYYKCNI